MALTEESRRSLFTKLVSVLGEADAVSLMDELPPPGEGAVSKAHMDQRFDAVDQRFDVVDQRFDAVERRVDEKVQACERRLGERIDERTAELRGEMAELRADLSDRLAKHTRVTVTATVTMNAATMAVVLSAVGLG